MRIFYPHPVSSADNKSCVIALNYHLKTCISIRYEDKDMYFVHLLLRQSIKLHRSYIHANSVFPLCLRPYIWKHLGEATRASYIDCTVHILALSLSVFVLLHSVARVYAESKLYTNRKHKYNVRYKYLFAMQNLENFGSSICCCNV